MSVKHLFTAEELPRLPDVPGKDLELVNGEVIEVSPAGMRHEMIVRLMYKSLDTFVYQHNLGYVAGDGLGYVLRRDPDTVRGPDISFIASEELAGRGVSDGFWEGAPTIAVEVVSPDDRPGAVHAKALDYLAAGTRLVWVLWPRRRSVTVYEPHADTRELGPDATLDGGDVLLGFSVRVGDLFDVRFPQ